LIQTYLVVELILYLQCMFGLTFKVYNWFYMFSFNNKKNWLWHVWL